MNKPLKVTLITIGSVFGLAILALALIPLLFEDRIVALVRAELEKRVDATIELTDVDLSLLSTFPNLTLEVTGLEVTGKGEFEGTRLLAAQKIGVGIGLFTLIREDSIQIESIEIEGPKIHVVVTDEGLANYDILIEPSEPEEPTEEVAFEIEDYRIEDGSIRYEAPGVWVDVEGMQHEGSLRVAGQEQELASATTIETLTTKLDDVAYLDRARANLDLRATVQGAANELALSRIRLALNELAIVGSGSVGWGGEGLAIDLEMASEEGLSVKALVSAIPDAYSGDFEGMKAGGTFTLKVRAKGELGPDDDDVPSFAITTTVRNGRLQYPDLPLAITDLQLDARVDHPGGNLDKMEIAVPKYGLTVGQSHGEGNLRITRPLSHPNVDLVLDGRFDLAEIAQAYPIPEVDRLEGLVEAEIDLETRGDRIERLAGFINASKIAYQSASLPVIRVPEASATLSPSNTKIEKLKAEVGTSDILVRGVASPLTTFLSDDETITMNASLISKRLRVEDFLGQQTPTESEEEGSEAASDSAFVLPDDLEAKLDFDVQLLTYGDLTLENFEGTGRIRDRKLILEDIRAKALGGSMTLEGAVATHPERPTTFDMSYTVDKASFARAFEALPSMRAYAPIARYLDGRFSTDLHASGTLGPDFAPKLDSIDAAGLVAAVQSKLSSDFKPLQELTSAVPAIPKPLDIESFRTRFAIDDGAVEVKPFTVDVKGLTMQVSGRHGLDQDMKYGVSTAVPIETLTSKLVSEVRSLGLDLAKVKTVGVQATLTGSIQSPRVSVKVDTGELRSAVADAVSDELEEQRARALEEAQAQADRLLAEAEKQAQRIRDEAKRAAEKVRQEGHARAKQVEQEAKGNPLAEIAAREAAKRIRSETDKRVDQMIAEANKRADQAVSEARKRAAEVVEAAETESKRTTDAVEGQTTDRIR